MAAFASARPVRRQDGARQTVPVPGLSRRPRVTLPPRTAVARVPARGTLYSFTFVHMPLFGSMRVEHMEGYGVGQVDLPEGPRLQVPLAGKKEDFRVGMRLIGELDALREEHGKEVVIIRFRPAES